MKKLLCFGAALLLAGCGVTPLVDKPDEQSGRFIFINKSGQGIRYIVIDRCGGMMSDGGRLEPHEVVYDGNQKVFTLSPGCWFNNFNGEFEILPGQDYTLTITGN